LSVARLDARILVVVIAVGCAKPVPLAVPPDSGTTPVDLGGRDLRAVATVDLAGVDLAGTDLAGADLSQSTLMCPMGLHSCRGTCIPDTNCCNPEDCPQYANSTAACAAGMCKYTCNSGYKDCNNSCRSIMLCCVDADCPLKANAMSEHCSADGMCSIGACKSGYVDFNKVEADGCECIDGGKASACTIATNVGSLAIGATKTQTGNLLTPTALNWFTVTFASNTNGNYHPRVRLTTNPGNQFAFDIVKDCSEAPITCGTEQGQTANSDTEWEVARTMGDPNGVGCGPTAGCHTCNCTPTGYIAVPAVGTSGTVKIKVYRISGMPSCDMYTLTISN
jgi:hypothetical protein